VRAILGFLLVITAGALLLLLFGISGECPPSTGASETNNTRGTSGKTDVYSVLSEGYQSDTTLIVAASDASNRSKSMADFTCDGLDDQAEINAAINAAADAGGGTVLLTEGTFECSGSILPLSHTTLRGISEDQTTLHFPDSRSGVHVLHLTDQNITLSDFRFTGEGYLLIQSSRIYVKNVTAFELGNAYRACFVVKNYGRTIEDIEFNNCKAINPDRFGFLCLGDDTNLAFGLIRNLRFIDCQAINCGRYGQAVWSKGAAWDVGFSYAESTNVEDVLFLNCLAEGSWESGFHSEYATSKVNVRFINCTSRDNNQKQKSGSSQQVIWGAGFMPSENTSFENCISENNRVGYYCQNANGVILNCTDRDSDIGFYILNVHSASTLEILSCTCHDEEQPVVITGEGLADIVIDGLTIISNRDEKTNAGIKVNLNGDFGNGVIVKDTVIQGYGAGITMVGEGEVNAQNVTVKEAIPISGQMRGNSFFPPRLSITLWSFCSFQTVFECIHGILGDFSP
jgi:hypothetical protein